MKEIIMKEITQYLSEDTSVYATALAAAKADYQHAVSVVAHEFYTQRNGVSIHAQELRALSNELKPPWRIRRDSRGGCANYNAMRARLPRWNRRKTKFHFRGGTL